MSADEWELIADRATAENRPSAASKAGNNAKKLRAMERNQPITPPDAGMSSVEFAREKFRIATSQFKIGLYSEAAESLRIVVRKDPSHAAGWHLLGMTLRVQHEDVGAEQAFRNSLKRNPRNPDAWLSLAELFLDTGRSSDALDAANRAIDVGPRAWEGRARVDVLLNEIAAKDLPPRIVRAPTASKPATETKPTICGSPVGPPPVKIEEAQAELSPLPWEIDTESNVEGSADIARDVAWDQDVPVKFSPEASSSRQTVPNTSPAVIRECTFCSNPVKHGECRRCGAKVCRHCGEMNFATAHTCANCSKDL